jgi:hypothetical protein
MQTHRQHECTDVPSQNARTRHHEDSHGNAMTLKTHSSRAPQLDASSARHGPRSQKPKRYTPAGRWVHRQPKRHRNRVHAASMPQTQTMHHTTHGSGMRCCPETCQLNIYRSRHNQCSDTGTWQMQGWARNIEPHSPEGESLST